MARTDLMYLFMTVRKDLIEQAERTNERLTQRLDSAVARAKKFPSRGRRTTAYAALQGHIQRLENLQEAVRRRLERRQVVGK